MYFQHRTLTIAKDAAKPRENQDAAACDPAAGVAAIADGASSSLQSGRWARLLVEGVIAGPPDIANAAELDSWLTAAREAWRSGIDEASLAWHQKARLADGAFSTLTWLTLTPGPDGTLILSAFAIGDSCLLHLRGGAVRRSFPLEESRLFSSEPALLGSTPRGAKSELTWNTLEDTCQQGDLLVLATDAVAAWALMQLESGKTLGLESIWDFDQEDFARWIERLRSEQQIRFDDSTVMLLRIQAPQMGVSLDDARDKVTDQLAQAGQWARRMWRRSTKAAE